MSKVFDSPLEEVVKARYSVRTYLEQPLSEENKEKLEQYISRLSNPFGGKVSFRLLALAKAPNARKLGTYGMIRGASDFIGVTAAPGAMDLESVGYEFEALILYAASIGLGTCWLGGTFNRSEFAEAMEVKEGDLFPAVSPVGTPAGKKSLREQMVRKTAHSDRRKPWPELFFSGDFGTPLTEAAADPYASALEMVRLAPSASNRQPWRIVRDGGAFHFFERKDPGYGDRLGFDIQRIDLGIAACHFDLTAREKDLRGGFQVLPDAVKNAPEHTVYLFSWVSEE